jgi:threonine/homoserine/homoserine lactone efflux protein
MAAAGGRGRTHVGPRERRRAAVAATIVAMTTSLPGALLAGVAAGYAVALPVGAVATYLVGLAARHPWRVGAAGALGVATVDGVYALLGALGGAVVAQWVAPVATPLRVVAAAVLVVVAVRSAVVAWRAWQAHAGPGSGPAGGAERTALGTWAHLVAVTAVNPATVLFFVVVVAGTVPPADGAGRVTSAVAFGVGAFVASASWQLALAGGGAVLGRFVTGHRGRLVTGLVSAAVIAVLAVHTMLG